MKQELRERALLTAQHFGDNVQRIPDTIRRRVEVEASNVINELLSEIKFLELKCDRAIRALDQVRGS